MQQLLKLGDIKKKLLVPGKHRVAETLELIVNGPDSGHWRQVLTVKGSGRQTELGLGPIKRVTPEQALEIAAANLKLAFQSIDPRATRQRKSEIPTFESAARQYHQERMPGWKEGPAQQEWLRRLELHAFPHIGRLRVSEIGPEHVKPLLMRIWLAKDKTARNVGQQIDAVLNASAAIGQRQGMGPYVQLLRGKALPEQTRATQHYAAMPYRDIPNFLAALDASRANPVTKAAIEFIVLTGVRPGNATNATWGQFDLVAATWTISGGDMKSRKGKAADFRIPLSDRAMAILADMRRLSNGQAGSFVFPGRKKGQPIGEESPTDYMGVMGVDATAHGFRSSFADWGAEQTHYPPAALEASLAHVEKSQVVRAYRRSDFFEMRREITREWALWCRPVAGVGSNVAEFSGTPASVA